MADEQDDSQKTEEPTRKRLEEAAERGQSVSSRELTSFLILFAFTMVMTSLAPGILRKSQAAISMFIERPDTIIIDNKESVGNLLLTIIQDCASILFVPFTLFVAAVIGSSVLQNRFIFSIEPIIPKLEKISIGKGIGRLFSMRSLVEFGKSLIKIILVAAIAYYAILPYFMHLKQLPNVSIDGIIAYLATTSKKMMIGICIAMFFIAVVDYMYQRFEFIKSLRMTKQELKDEYRQQEGDPLVKQKIRQLRIERSKKRMMAAVPTADVIITNPTHYSIALKYDSSMPAPKVVAKGVDFLALKIREIAKEHDIPLVENPPLAQALYATVDIDKEISSEHYKAVAE
ncbi:MAG: flagellar biosynthesis protein FlhB, partial [Pseudomonadota bacterium]